MQLKKIAGVVIAYHRPPGGDHFHPQVVKLKAVWVAGHAVDWWCAVERCDLKDYCCGCLVEALKNAGSALPAADAHRHQAVARAAALQFVKQLHS